MFIPLTIVEKTLRIVKAAREELVALKRRLTKYSFFGASCSLAVTVATMAPHQASARDPRIEWHQIETEHFRVLFDSRHYELGRRYAEHAERSWQILAPVLRSFPDKTTVLIDDTQDVANGAATVFPYPTVFIYPAPPEAGGSIADSGPWSFELMAHEYTHIANMEPTHGFFRILRNLFGSIVRPNMMLPRWYLEGLAVELETRFSPSGGRLRSPNFTAIPRAMVEAGTLEDETISRINETSIPDFPGGNRPYLMGAMLWHHLAAKDTSTIGELNDRYAKRVPFFINGPIEDKVGLDWSSLLFQVYRETRERAQMQIDVICSAGCEEGSLLGEGSFYSRSPEISRHTGDLVFLSRTHHRDTRIEIAKGPDWKHREVVAEPFQTHRVSWMPNDQGLLYDGMDFIGERLRFELRTDLYLRDLKKKKSFRLTRGLRAREAAANAKGLIAFVQLTPGGSQIALGQLDGSSESNPNPQLKDVQTLFRPDFDHRVFWPEWLDETTLMFTLRRPDATESIWVLTIGQDPYRLELNGHAAFPRLVAKSSAAEAQILFSSARSGVTNIYSAQLVKISGRWKLRSQEALHPLTNSTTRAWIADVDPKTQRLVYSRLDGDGSRLRVSTETLRSGQPALKAASRLPAVDPLFSRTHAPFELPEVNPMNLGRLEAEPYDLTPFLVPQYWMPYGVALPGGAFLSAATSVGDPMGRHSVAAQISTDTRVGRPNGFLGYTNFTTPVRMTAMVDDNTQSLFASGLIRQVTSADLAGQFFLPGLSNQWRGEFGMSHQTFSTELSSDKVVLTKGGPRAGLVYRNLIQRGLEVVPENGSAFRLSHEQLLPDLGSLSFGKTDIGGTAFFSNSSHPTLLGWLPDLHAFQMSASVSWAPQLDRLLIAPSSVAVPIENVALGSLTTSFLMRGYPSGAFLGRKVVKGSLEYSFPAWESFRGAGTTPFFRRRWVGSVFVDAVTVEGRFVDWDFGFQRAELGNLFGSAGAELKLETTTFYHIPLNLVFGLHYGFDRRINPFGVYPVIYFSL